MKCNKHLVLKGDSMMKKETVSKNGADIKKEYYNLFYGGYYDKWNYTTTDDRKLFCNIYEMILEEIEDYNVVKSVGTRVAINDDLRKKEIELKDIISRFEYLGIGL